MYFWQDPAQTGMRGLAPVTPPWRQAQRPSRVMFSSSTWSRFCLLPWPSSLFLFPPASEKLSGGGKL